MSKQGLVTPIKLGKQQVSFKKFSCIYNEEYAVYFPWRQRQQLPPSQKGALGPWVKAYQHRRHHIKKLVM